MKNLENYGVLELNTQEIRETDGGFWGPLITGTIAAVTGVWVVGEKIGRTLAHYY